MRSMRCAATLHLVLHYLVLHLAGPVVETVALSQITLRVMRVLCCVLCAVCCAVLCSLHPTSTDWRV
jgi:hypothetical protein